MPTVVVTGASGFIAKHIVNRLLARGHAVRAGLRTPARGEEVRAAVAPGLPDGALERLSFAALDLERDAGWQAALDGADALLHTASPFPLANPKDPATLIRPAVEGTRRALEAAVAAGVPRVVVTSSSTAISNADLPPGKTRYDETVWSDETFRTTTPYARSKLLAERTAWEIAAEHPDLRLTVINPVLVAGPPRDRHYGTSLRVIERILQAKDPALPVIAFGVVDVRDVAEAHVRAVERPETAGERILVADDTLWFPEIADMLKAEFPARRIVTRRAPAWLLRLMAFVDPAVASILPALGRFEAFDSGKARRLLGLDFIPAREAVLASARWMVGNGTV